VYEYGFLVSSIVTARGSRHRVLYSLGSLAGFNRDADGHLAIQLERMISGQQQIGEAEQRVKDLFSRLRPAHGRGSRARRAQEVTEVASTDPGIDVDVEMAEESVLMLPSIGSTTTMTQMQIPDIDVQVRTKEPPPEWLEVNTRIMAYHDAKEAGPVHVGHQMWQRLGLTKILRNAGLSDQECKLTEVLTLNRLVEPASEHATPNWVERTALVDILGESIEHLNYRTLYGNLDKLHPQRGLIEQQLFERERNLFNLQNSLFLYDLTSTYMEGKCEKNPAMKHGYSRDSRPDCRQVVIGLMLNRDGFPIGHEIFDGNTSESKTVSGIFELFEERTGMKSGATIVVDRGMSGKETLEMIRARGHHYIVAAKQTERAHWLAEFESEEGWRELTKLRSSINPEVLPTGVKIKRFEKDDEYFVLCISEGRIQKDRAIREKHEERLVRDLKKLQTRIDSGVLKVSRKVYESIGRLKERYPRVCRYYDIEFDQTNNKLHWQQNADRKSCAEKVDGGYILRTTRKDLMDDEIWKTYILLTRVESAFCDLKSPLSMRPIFHQLQHRTESHIFICILAYHLLVSIEHLLHAAGISSSWETIRKELSTHQVVSGSFLTRDMRIFEARRDTNANARQMQLYSALNISHQIMTSPTRRWVV